MKKKTAVFVSSNNVGVYSGSQDFDNEKAKSKVVASAPFEKIKNLVVSDCDYLVIYASRDFFGEILQLVKNLTTKVIVFYCLCEEEDKQKQIENIDFACDIEFRTCECGGVEGLGRLHRQFMQEGVITENSMTLKD